jgi:hypothetical protein
METKGKKGGAREGAGRPKLEITRKTRAFRAFDDEWEVIQEIARKLKKGEISIKELRKWLDGKSK